MATQKEIDEVKEKFTSMKDTVWDYIIEQDTEELLQLYLISLKQKLDGYKKTMQETMESLASKGGNIRMAGSTADTMKQPMQDLLDKHAQVGIYLDGVRELISKANSLMEVLDDDIEDEEEDDDVE